MVSGEGVLHSCEVVPVYLEWESWASHKFVHNVLKQLFRISTAMFAFVRRSQEATHNSIEHTHSSALMECPEQPVFVDQYSDLLWRLLGERVPLGVQEIRCFKENYKLVLDQQ